MTEARCGAAVTPVAGAAYDRRVDEDRQDGRVDVERATVFVRGRVQGVGFRWWTRARALELGLVGWARNTADGRVEVVAEGRRADVEALHGLLAEEPSTTGRPGHVALVSSPLWAAAKGESGVRER